MPEEYWKRFEKTTKDGRTIRDGAMFESLVKYLLEAEFKTQWIQTGASHDDNRDFYLYRSRENHIWVECKNYRPKLDMSVIAPTLVMAEIHEVKKILFFSSSSFNNSAKEKLYLYAEKTKKKITLYDGKTLLSLINKHNDYLPERFKLPEDFIEGMHPPICNFMYIQNPILGVALEDKLIHPLHSVKSIVFNSPFEIALLVQNPSALTKAHVRITILKQKQSVLVDDNFYELLDKKCKRIDQYFRQHTLAEGGGVFIRFFIKQLVFKEKIRLPRIRVTVYTQEDEGKYSFTSPSMVVKSRWEGEISTLVGSEYRSLRDDFEKYTVNNDELSIFSMEGVSGVGKTRVLREIIDKLLTHRYRILSFLGDEENKYIMFLREIIFFLYEIPRSDILDEMEKYISDDSELYKGKSHVAWNIIRVFSNAKTWVEYKQAIDEFGPILYEKLSASPIAIIIDNLQYFDKEVMYFIDQFCNYSLAANRSCQTVIACSFNTEYLEDASSMLLSKLKKWQNQGKLYIQHRYLTGFKNEKQCVIYLRELMNIKSQIYDELLSLLAKKFTYKPYHLSKAVKFLYSQNPLLRAHEMNGYPITVEFMQRAIDLLPPDIEHIISKNWDSLNDDSDRSKYKLIISCLLLFHKIDENLFDRLLLDQDTLADLEEKSFIRKEISRRSELVLVFEHDIIEKYFAKRYPKLPSLAVQYIIDKNIDIAEYSIAWTICQLVCTTSGSSISGILQALPSLNVHRAVREILIEYWIQFIERNVVSLKPEASLCDALSKMCDRAIEYLGIHRAVKIFDKALCLIRPVEDRVIEQSPIQISTFVQYFINVMFHLRNPRKGISLINYYLDKLLRLANRNIRNDGEYCDELNFSIGEMYNRLHLNYRVIETDEGNRMMLSTLATSREYVKKISSPILRGELEWLNYSDEGYIYYCFLDNKEKLVEVWSKWINYKDLVPKKTLNFYRKQIQLLLIEKRSEEALQVIAEGEEYLQMGDYRYAGLSFSTFFTEAKLVALLQQNQIRNKSIIGQILAETVENELLTPYGKNHIFLQIAGIHSFYIEDKQGVCCNFKQSYLEFCESQSHANFKSKLKLLSDNLLYALVSLNIHPHPDADFTFWEPDPNYIRWIELSNCSHHTRAEFINNWKALGILQTADGIMNFPLI